MKIIKLILVLQFLGVSFFSEAQIVNEIYQKLELDSTRDGSGRLELSTVVESKNPQISKDQLFEAVRFAIFKNFKSGANVIEYQSKEEGKIYCRTRGADQTFKNGGIQHYSGFFKYDLTVLCKDGRAKIIANEITHQSGDMGGQKTGSDLGDSFPSQWKYFEGIGKNYNKKSQKEWDKMVENTYVDIAGVFNIIREAIVNASPKKEDF